MRKILAVLLAVVLVLPTLAACDLGGAPEDNVPPAHEHTVVIDEAVAPTCIQTGLTSGAHCSECGEVLVKQETVSKLDHTLIIDEAVESTCSSTGLTSGVHCSECKEILIAQSEISPKTHTYDDKYDEFCNVCGYKRDAECAHLNIETIPGKPATCTAEGLTAGEKCVKCGEILMAQEIVPASEHSFVKSVCEICGAIDGSTGLAYEANGDGTCTITGIGSCTDLDIIIPEYIDGYNVTSIGDWAFNGCRNLTSIEIPDSVTSIGSSAFSCCYSLTSIVIPDSVTSIGWHAFLGSGLTSIIIPDSVTSISSSAFSCDNLESIIVEQGNPVYHSAGNCLIETATKTLITGCENSVIPTDRSVTSIGDDAFDGCRSLTSIVIPDSVTSIGDAAFGSCYGLTSIVIPDSVTSIGDYVFFCSGLTSVVIGNGVTSISDYAFSGCSNLENIIVKKENTVFHSAGNCIIETATKTLVAGCKNSVIPTDGSVTSIGNMAFDNCTSLTSIIIPDSVTSIGEYAFGSCYGLTSIVIPDSVMSIGWQAFGGCSSLASVVIGNGVTSIDFSAFWGCSNLENIIVKEENTIFHSAGICIIETATKTLIAGCNNSVIPTDGSVTSIGNHAFYGCDSLTSIVIPDNVTSIGWQAFSFCSNLTSIVIPDSVTSIDGMAFAYSWSLTSIVIPDSVMSIGWQAFEGCSSLTSIEYEGTKAQWDAISKGYGWNYETGDYTVHCTDGDITKY